MDLFVVDTVGFGDKQYNQSDILYSNIKDIKNQNNIGTPNKKDERDESSYDEDTEENYDYLGDWKKTI